MPVLQPDNATHRQYEALRAYFVEGVSAKEAAKRFAYTTGTFRVMACQFAKDPKRRFFVEPSRGPGKSDTKRQSDEKIVTLRKQNLSIV